MGEFTQAATRGAIKYVVPLGLKTQDLLYVRQVLNGSTVLFVGSVQTNARKTAVHLKSHI